MRYELKFQAPAHLGINSTEFYQDPQDQSHKKVVSTVTFSSIEPAGLKHLSMELVTKRTGEAQPALPIPGQLRQAARQRILSTPIRCASRITTRRWSSMSAPASAPPTAANRRPKGRGERQHSVFTTSCASAEANLTLVNSAQYEPNRSSFWRPAPASRAGMQRR